MNKRIIICMLALLVLVSCEKDNTRKSAHYAAKLEESHLIWMNSKSVCNDTYRYQVEGSSWIGTSWQTTITVVNGTVTQRSFELKYQGETEISWIEYENEIGINNEGAEPLTLDQLYSKAKTEWLTDRGDAKIFLETDANGLISLCGYVLNGCMDDCFIGIHISYIKALGVNKG